MAQHYEVFIVNLDPTIGSEIKSIKRVIKETYVD